MFACEFCENFFKIVLEGGKKKSSIFSFDVASGDGSILPAHSFTIFTVAINLLGTISAVGMILWSQATMRDDVVVLACCLTGSRLSVLPPMSLVPIDEEVCPLLPPFIFPPTYRLHNQSRDNQDEDTPILTHRGHPPSCHHLSVRNVPRSLTPWPSPCWSGVRGQMRGVWVWVWGACVQCG